MATDTYRLRRDQAASSRLNLQHVQWVDIFGWILHPDIEAAIGKEEDVEIVDVGTGTGIVPLQLSRDLTKQPKSLVGLDISDAQFPYSGWWPENVQLTIGNALDPNGPPLEFKKRFDVVHVRFFLSLIKDDPGPFIDYLLKLLKPGGYLQWGEPMVDSMAAVPDDKKAPGIAELVGLLHKHVQVPWLEKLPDILEKRGFEIVKVLKNECVPWQRGWNVDGLCSLTSEMLGSKVSEACDKAIAERQEGCWVRFKNICIVAQLPKASTSGDGN